MATNAVTPAPDADLALLATPSADRPKAVLNFVSLHASLVNEDIHKRPFDSMFTDARVG
jgi:hypothetical protein